MNNQTVLKIATLAMAGVVLLTLGWSMMKSSASGSTRGSRAASSADNVSAESGDVTAAKSTISDLGLGNFGSAESQSSDAASEESSNAELPEITLRVGKIGSTPDRQEVTMISQLPYTNSEVRRIYTASAGRACRMLVPGSPVVPTRLGVRPGRMGTYGRVPTFSIGLQLGSDGRDKLPAVTRAQVEKYLRKHRLSVQPILYHDENGKLYFGTDCQTAFFELDRPGVTVEAEPMVATAVERFRALGIVGDGSIARISSVAGTETLNTVLGRTLAMAFTFEKAEGLLALKSAKPKLTSELLLLHLPSEATADNPNIKVFITSDERHTLHRLDIGQERLNSPIPTITADIRFAKTVLMGMYPAGPIVTSIRYRSDGVVPMEAILKMTRTGETGDETNSPMSVTEILDQFGDLSRQMPDSFNSGLPGIPGQRPSMIENRLDRLLERRSNTFENFRSPGAGVPGADSPAVEPAAPKVKLMTGLGK